MERSKGESIQNIYLRRFCLLKVDFDDFLPGIVDLGSEGKAKGEGRQEKITPKLFGVREFIYSYW